MIDFNEEIKKFANASLVEDVESEVYSYNKKDLIELVNDILKEAEEK